MKQWDEVYKRDGKGTIVPQEGIGKIIQVFKQHRIKKVLDLGCGTGRHLTYLAGGGFKVYGYDVAETGMKIAQNWLKEKGLQANLRIGSIYEALPYEDRFFDAVISIRAIYHARIEDVRKAIKEVERILKPQGLIFMTFRKRIPKKKRLKFDPLDAHTYIPTEGDEKGLVHYLFNKKLLRKEFNNFKITEIWVDSDSYYCMLAEKKSH